MTGSRPGPGRSRDVVTRSKGGLTSGRRPQARSRHRLTDSRWYPGGGGGLAGSRGGLPGSQSGPTGVRGRLFGGWPRMARSRRTTGWVLRGPA